MSEMVEKTEQAVRVAHDPTAGVLHLTLNRPHVRNAFTAEMHRQLADALTFAVDTPTVRAVIITGAGVAFCAGQDLGERRAYADDPNAPPDLGASLRARYNPLVHTLLTLPKPVIAAVNGVAAGAGAGLACACDIRIGSDVATFLLSFANVGLGLDSGLSYTLPRLIGTGRALDVALRGGRIAAVEAERIGLLSQVVAPDALDTTARDLAATLAAKSAGAMAAIKRTLNADAFDDALELEATLQDERGRSAGYREGLRAFFDKRPPDFRRIGD